MAHHQNQTQCYNHQFHHCIVCAKLWIFLSKNWENGHTEHIQIFLSAILLISLHVVHACYTFPGCVKSDYIEANISLHQMWLYAFHFQTPALWDSGISVAKINYGSRINSSATDHSTSKWNAGKGHWIIPIWVLDSNCSRATKQCLHKEFPNGSMLIWLPILPLSSD